MSELPTRCLIGSSNVSRFYKIDDFPNFTPCIMPKCCTIESFKVRMEELEEANTEIIISVIENFFCDAVGETREENLIDDKIEEVMADFLTVVKVTAERLSGSRFALGQPIRRPRDLWYTSRLPNITKRFCDGIGNLGLKNVSWVEAPTEKEQIFDALGVHLNKEAGTFYVESLMSKASEFFVADLMEVIDTEDEDEEESDIVMLDAGTQRKKKEGKIQVLERDLTNFKADVLKRRHFDSMVTARLAENQDVELNKTKEDRIIINGLTNTTPCPVGVDEKKKWMLDMVTPIVDAIVEKSSEEIVFVTLAGTKERDIPLCEVRFRSKEMAMKVRREFAAKKKGGKDFGRIAIFNSVTLSTRVRIEILWAMAKKCCNEKEIASVQSYISRPTLLIKDREGKRRPMNLGFADAIKRYGRILREGDLASAYRKAGTSFEGQLQQNFVVLHDLNQAKPGPWGGKGGGTTFPQSERKRAREPETKNGPKGPKGPKGPGKNGGKGGKKTAKK